LSKTKTCGGRNGKIEFLRFFFSVIIVIHHSRKILGDNNCWFLGGSLAVEFFFIVSGYLMMHSITKAENNSVLSLGKETGHFLLKKIKVLYPEILVGFFISASFIALAEGLRGMSVVKFFIDSIWDITPFIQSGLTYRSVNGVVWYISSMILCMAVLYPLIRKYKDFMLCVIVPLLIFLSYGYLCRNFTDPRNPTVWLGFTYKGNIRALGDICLGIVAFVFVSWLSKINFTFKGKVFLTIVEFFAYLSEVLYMFFYPATRTDFVMIFVFALAISITFSGKSVDLGIFQNKVCIWLGKYSLSLYLGHNFYAHYFRKLFPTFGDKKVFIVYMAASILTGLAIMYISKLIRIVIPKALLYIRGFLIER